MAEKPLSDRAAKLTPREWRVVALLLEGVGSQAACDALGVAPGTLESHKQAIRRKLAVPRGVRLEGYLREHVAHLPIPEVPAALAAPSERPGTKKDEDRRIRWLLRLTLQELSEVAASAGLRSELLEQTVKRMGTTDPGEAEREIRDLQHVASEVAETYRRLLEHARRRD
jgi:DNA-binding CsgD family transcriptional regulator